MATVLVPVDYPSLDLIRARVVTVLEAALTGWRESVFTPSMVGRDGGPAAGKVFSVELPGTDFAEVQRRRRGAAYATEPWQADTAVTVRWLWTLRADGQKTDYAAGLRAEHTLIGALLAGGMDGTNTHAIQISAARREVLGDGAFLLGTVTASIGHVYPIDVTT